MRKTTPALLFFLLILPLAQCFAQSEEIVLFTPNNLPQTHLNDTQAQLSEDGSCARFVALGKRYQWPGPVVRGKWDISGCNTLRIVIRNCEKTPLTFHVRMDDPAARQNNSNWFTKSFTIPAGERVVQEIALPRPFPKQLSGKIEGMRGLPGGAILGTTSMDWREVIAFYIFLSDVHEPKSFEIEKVYAIRKSVSEQDSDAAWRSMEPDEFFPMIDVYGQFKYEDWPGKIHNDAEFAQRIADESADVARNPRPADWSAFGGWKSGPRFEAAGRFRVQKVDDKWWFVDPEGYLFWSHGVDCVGSSNGVGPISHREHYFEGLPAADSPFARFYGGGSSAIGFYKDKGWYKTYNWTQSNLMRKYGADFKERHDAQTQARLASWGMNTIGNWSDAQVYRLRKTPYVLTIGNLEPRIEGSSGYWGKFPDPFAPEFREKTRSAIRSRKEFLGDPWCLGAFVNNEISWGGEYSLSQAALASPATQPAKIEFLRFLREKYDTIENLNAVWETTHESWGALLQATEPPTSDGAKPDLGEFYTRIAEQYFRVIHEELRAADPQLLDMGCRFAWTNPRAAHAMAKFVDVMSYNLYRDSVADFRLLEGIDLPCIIGEFHFGALDRGVFHTGLRGAKNQVERAEKYYNYVRGALENPCLVGTHWFQYGAQATTGRFDGENYQIGLVDIGDTPYPEIIAKVREIGNSMYQIRSESKDKKESNHE
ncbi:MAG: beta-agarase [Planctomycetia bacterium]|nr:beta-agarase [Planctomycetia bacterium]